MLWEIEANLEKGFESRLGRFLFALLFSLALPSLEGVCGLFLVANLFL